MSTLPSVPPIGSLSHIDLLAALDPALGDHVSRSLASSYDDFVDRFWHDFDFACAKLQERRDQYFAQKEDVITAALAMCLDGMGYNASHDTKVNGHVDLVVRGKRAEHLWIGEAKRDTSITWISKGFDQLCVDYATGGLTQDVGALIIYCQASQAAARRNEWMEYLKARKIDSCIFEECEKLPQTAFKTQHKLASSGTVFKTRHIALNLFKVPAVKKVASKRALTAKKAPARKASAKKPPKKSA